MTAKPRQVTVTKGGNVRVIPDELVKKYEARGWSKPAPVKTAPSTTSTDQS